MDIDAVARSAATGGEAATMSRPEPTSHPDHLAPAPFRLRGLSGENARLWREFAIWCAATGRTGLPAGADTVLTFLAEHPGRPGVQRNRLTAIHAAHKLTKQPSPAAAESVRQALNPGRSQRLAAARAHADLLIPHLPSQGWEGLDGRRDAALLLLATAGPSWRHIAALTQNDVVITDDRVAVGAQPLVELPATREADCPVVVFRRWMQIAAAAPTPTGHITITRILESSDSTPPAAAAGEFGHLTLWPRFDERGMATGYIDDLEGLPAQEIAAIVSSRLLTPILPSGVPDLDGDYYDRGVAARWRAQPIRDELDDLLDRFDELAEAIDDRFTSMDYLADPD